MVSCSRIRVTYRYRKVTACSRVTEDSGAKRVSVTPLARPTSWAQAMASVKYRFSGTSVKEESSVTSGSPARRYRVVTSIPRVSLESGANRLSETPFISS